MGNYHLGKDGTPKRCRAKVVACPLGSISDHYNTVAEAQNVADDIFEQLSSAKGFGIAVNGGTQRIDSRTEVAITRLNNLKVVMNRLENIKKNARANILSEMSDKNVSSLKGDTATLSKIDGFTKTVIDTDKLKSSGEYDEYSKDSNVKEHVAIMSGDEPHADGSELTDNQKKIKAFRRKMETPSGKSLEFNLSVDKDGNAVLNIDNEKALEDLRRYEETLDKLNKLDKELRAELMETMKEKNVKVIQAGEASIVYNPESTRRIVDTTKLKKDGKYSQYSKETETKDSLRIKFAKE